MINNLTVTSMQEQLQPLVTRESDASEKKLMVPEKNSLVLCVSGESTLLI